ncbi:DUF1036 domain-containing protein [Roseibaca sp. Y0-43]|uniref:DUF1036 domain-containing protein n=1 Tax=Roseibaca sp. Y0-43 TaxID=2816854 RepID=UPI001D0C3A7B|nr:DUF1036 domain-containing protein [Roseibaca sp. Y0-43]MCC1482230.1 DUF1036 domain-containing protein [Roseibaca sp. Y0-43]
MRSLILTAFALPLLATPDTALAELRFCNETNARVTVAIGYRSDGAWRSEGWWAVEPDACRAVVSEPLENRFYYYRATSKLDSWTHETYYFCTSPQPFDIMGDEECAARGYDREAFSEIALSDGITRFTMTLTSSKTAPPPPAPPPAPAPMAQGDAPGTHGEPYTVAGLLSHCEVTDASVQCELHNDGWRYVASSAFYTDQALLERMMDLAPNTPMTWVGDLAGYGGANVDVTIREARVEGSDPYARLRAELQGFWTSTSDPNYQLLIAGGVFEEWYQNIPSDTRLMELANTCEGAMGDGPYLLAQSYARDGDIRCFEVFELSQDSLSLFPLGVMQPLDFYRSD